jgi:general secretion pathway protein H
LQRRNRGFTLIELLLVLLVMGVALSLVAIAGISNPQRELRFDAEKLAQLLFLAREEAQVRGQAIRVQADDQGYSFLVVKDREWAAVTDDADLRARQWGQATQWRLQREDDRPTDKDRGTIEFGRDLVDHPFTIELTREGAKVQVMANGLGRFTVE